jgi:hypothetical protein
VSALLTRQASAIHQPLPPPSFPKLFHIDVRSNASSHPQPRFAADIGRNDELVLTTRLEAIGADKAQLDVTRPLSPPALASLQQRLRLEWTPYASATEHHTLSVREAQVVSTI